jgi:DNA-binding transcriptional ArsR family regulator
LDGIFAALSDPTRRAVLARLSEAPELSVTALAQPFAMSLPAVLKHLDVLEVAGLIRRRKSGRTVSCRLNAAPLQEAQRWLAHYERFWSDRLDALARYLADEAAGTSGANSEAATSPTPHVEPQPCPPTLKPPPLRGQNPASSSGASSRRRQTAAFAPGSSRKR